jgi:hypothetical protein
VAGWTLRRIAAIGQQLGQQEGVVGRPRNPFPVKLVMPMFTRCAELFETAERTLVDLFGPTDYRSERLPFEHTTYYEGEFGRGLERQFLSFETLIDPGRLAEIKVLTNALEKDWGVAGRRSINLDPGYISLAKLVLATTKDREHRVYLGSGIFAEVTLTYRRKAFRPWPWTYPDYSSEAYLEIMRIIRGLYVEQLKALRQAGRLTQQPG